MAVKCYYFDVSALTEAQYDAALAALPWEERRQRVGRLLTAEARRLCLGAGALLAFALGQAGATDLTLQRGPQGKPALAHHPDIHFNLSHSGTMAVCAVADRAVGVDVEQPREIREALVRRVLTAEEQAWLASQADKETAFIRLWTRKESYLKWAGEGLSRRPDTFSVLSPAENISPAGFAEKVIADYRVCVCCEGAETTLFLPWEFPELPVRSQAGN